MNNVYNLPPNSDAQERGGGKYLILNRLTDRARYC